MLTNYVRWYAPGESFYAYLLDAGGKVIDDLLIYRRGKELFQIVVNASNADKDWAWLNAVNNGEVLIDRERPDLRVLRPATLRNLKDPSSGPDMRIDLALQGPASLKILQSLTDDPKIKTQLARVRKTGVTECVLGSFDLVIARTGYCGEEVGFELFVHPDRAVEFWETLLEAGKPFGLQPTGLAARTAPAPRPACRSTAMSWRATSASRPRVRASPRTSSCTSRSSSAASPISKPKRRARWRSPASA